MQALIDEARRRGAEELFLEVRFDNEGAKAMYADSGSRPSRFASALQGRDRRAVDAADDPDAADGDRMTSAPLVLGIETSCDETGIGIVRGTELLANAIASSMDEHARYGGVVPEVAARAHSRHCARPWMPRSPRRA